MNQENKPKILANCGLKKLKEYSRSYGGIETLTVPFIKDWGGEITLHYDTGECYRTIRKGTKLLIDYRGEAISERQFVTRTNKAKKQRDIERKKRAEIEAAQMAEKQAKAAIQAELWAAYLASNPEKVRRYQLRVNSSPSNSSRSGNWRNWIRMKAAQKIAGEKFNELALSAPELCKILFEVQ